MIFFSVRPKSKKMKKLVGKVTESEKREIQALFERRNGLVELAKVVVSTDETLYEKVVQDLGQTSTKFQNWWDRMSAQYQWERRDDGNWEIDFQTNDIYLLCPD